MSGHQLRVSATALAYMKLESARGKDRDDVVAMMRAGSLDVGALIRATEKDDALRIRPEAAIAECDAAET